jgi:SAM-dependent methyltransferase
VVWISIATAKSVDVLSSYDAAADAYAAHLFHELERKPLDRHLLNRFAEAVEGRGLIADLGCGPGHVAKYLSERGASVCGIDISPGMVRCAARLCPGLEFRIGDMRALAFPSGAFAGVVAFYSIVHFAADELEPVFREVHRVMVPAGPMLLAFHIGQEVVHVDDLYGQQVSLDFHFHSRQAVTSAIESAGFAVTESTEREPYEGAEYPSRRCYLFATRR